MGKTAVMVRLSETELSALDALALKSGISRATCATSILRQRLGAGPNESLGARNGRLQDEANAACAHPYRDNTNKCRVCGDQR